MTGPVVEINQGKLRGKISEAANGITYFTFKGVPYAQPPIGELRFRDPLPPEPWQGELDATKDCNMCPQFDKETSKVVGDEDCLVLNVYTPKLPDSNAPLFPVMFFIHGGGFAYGTGTDDEGNHSPEYLIQKNVIVVSINFRIGILGFLNLNRLEAPGNMGLKDQAQALRWVKTNIKHFNGNPDNVTIFGISAGGASVEYLMISPMSRGLFHKAIAQSGSTLNHWTINQHPIDTAFRVAKLKDLNITNEEELYQYLKKLSIKDLVTSAQVACTTEDFRGGIHFGFVPSIEKNGNWNTFLNGSTYELIKKGEFAKVPFISGFCSDEGLLMRGLNPIKLDSVKTEKKFVQHLPFKLDETYSTELENKLKIAYLEHSPDNFAVDLFTDIDFLGGIYVAAKLMSKKHSAVYFYEFAYDGRLNYLKKKLNLKMPGVCHGDDGGYLLKTNVLKNVEPTAADLLIRERMVRMWTDFAKHGNPTPSQDEVITTIWEPITENVFNYLVVDEAFSLKQDLLPHRMKMYENLYENNWFKE